MTVMIDFHLDTSGEEGRTKTIQSPYADLGKTRDNLDERLDKTAQGSKALMPVRDAGSGDYVFVNTMKVADITIREE